MRLPAVVPFLFISLLANEFNYNFKPVKVSSDIYCFFGKPQAINKENNGNMVNSCFIDMGKSYLVIDSGPTYNYAKEAYDLIQEQKKLPVAYILNTHVHDDHWLGNSFYKELGVDIIGSKEFEHEAKVETTRMQRRISKEAYKGTTQEFPNIFVDQEKTVTVDGKKVEIRSVNNKAHTKGDLFIHIPSKSALFTGDLVFNDRLLSLRDGDINGWIDILEELKKGDYKYIIGGHGRLVKPGALDVTYNYLIELRAQVREALEEGEDIEDAVENIVMPKYKDMAMYDMLHKQNVETAYRTLEWEQ